MQGLLVSSGSVSGNRMFGSDIDSVPGVMSGALARDAGHATVAQGADHPVRQVTLRSEPCWCTRSPPSQALRAPHSPTVMGMPLITVMGMPLIALLR